MSRSPDQWLNPSSLGSISLSSMESGNAINQIYYITLLLASFVLLSSRSIDWVALVKENLPVCILLCYELASITWSDYTSISLKRWIRGAALYLVVVTILSERQPLRAISSCLRYSAYLFVPLSVILIKYYPGLSIQYGAFSGAPEYCGAALSKNTLGASCLVCGISLLWSMTMQRRKRRGFLRRTANLDMIMLFITISLLHMSGSTTSEATTLLDIEQGPRRATNPWPAGNCWNFQCM